MNPVSARAALIASALVCLLSPAARAAPAPQSVADSASADTLSHVVTLPAIEVSTSRAGVRVPVARSVIGRRELVERNQGLDTPMLLATLPGAYAYSDAGNGVGYSYLSIRGFPQRRISVLVDGVPLNDPQSHEVYWIDHPDLLASTSEVQVQRGVGSALYGAASLGGSVNIETSPFTETPETRVTVAYGSYETKRVSLETSSGRLAGGWNAYGRYSRVESFGYRDDSWSKLWSYTLSVRRQFGRQSLRGTLFGGPEETHLAYLGVPGEYLRGEVTGDADRDRRFNPITYPNERDHFFEPHYELVHDWSPRDGLALSQTLFWFDGRGYYDEQRFGRALADYRLASWATADSTLLPRDHYRDADEDGVLDRDGQGRAIVDRFDVVRRRTVANRNFGWVPRVRMEHTRGALTVGGELRAADGRHWGEVVSGAGLPPGTPADHAYYDYHPRTRSAGVFAREEWNAAEALVVTADLGWRHQAYEMRGDHFDGIRFDQSYDFVTPRLGLTWAPRASLTAFAAWARSSREPAFRDLYDAEGAGSVPLYRVADVTNNVYRDPLIDPETVNDWEAGARWSSATARLELNAFRMDFDDELVYAGQFNTDLGYPILGNAAQSIHQGVEAAGGWARGRPAGSRISLEANLSVADNHFVHYREVYGTTPADVVSYDGNAIGFFPAVLANAVARWSWREWALGTELHHAGRMYLDNTETKTASIAPHATVDLEARTGWALAPAVLRGRIRVQNLLDRRYETGGYMDYDATGALVPFRIPAARRNWMVALDAQFR